MSGRSASTVYVALPVWNGTRFVAEAIRWMLPQTHRDLRLMISVDGDDRASAAACEPFLADPRVRMTVQPERLGWIGSMDWLIERCDGDLFTHRQQDDLVEPTYLERLIEALADEPDAAGAYADLRWFEGRSDAVVLPSLRGFTQASIPAAIQTLHWLPLRALVPAEVLRRIGPVRGVDGAITCADYLTVLRLAAAGDLVRVPEVLYHKRSHATSASHRAADDHDPVEVSDTEPLTVALELYRAMETAAGRRLRPPVPPGSTEADALGADLRRLGLALGSVELAREGPP